MCQGTFMHAVLTSTETTLVSIIVPHEVLPGKRKLAGDGTETFALTYTYCTCMVPSSSAPDNHLKLYSYVQPSCQPRGAKRLTKYDT